MKHEINRDGGGFAAGMQLHGRKRLQFFWDYYKLPIIIILIAIYIIGFMIYRQVTKKDTVLSVACVNMNISKDTQNALTDGFLQEFEGGSRRNQIEFYTNLLVPASEDSESGAASSDGAAPSDGASSSDDAVPTDGATYDYAYSSQLKLLAMITDKSLDVVLMDDAAYGVFSRNDYLLPLTGREAETLNSDSILTAKGDAMDVTDGTRLKGAGLSGKIYAGIIANSQHVKTAVRYLNGLA